MSIDPLLPTPSPTAALPSRSRRRWLKWVVGVLLVLLMAVWFAPSVAARTGLRNHLARRVAHKLHGSIVVGSASLGWLAPVELRQLVLTDAHGRVVVSIPKATSSKSLVALLWSRADLGEFHLEQPTVDVVVENGSTNLEDLLQAYWPDDSPAAPRVPVQVRVTAGRFRVREAHTGQTGELENVDATVTIPSGTAEPVVAQLSVGESLKAQVRWGDTGAGELTAQAFPLQALAPLLPRFQPGISLAGSLTAHLTAGWGSATTLAGELSVQNLALTAPWLGQESLRLASARLPLEMTLTGSRVQITRADLTSDLGTASIRGTFSWDASLAKLLEEPGVKVDATLDLAQLAATLPNLLHIRGGTVVREGQLVVTIGSTATAPGTTWSGAITTSALKAIREGREVLWNEPLSVEFTGQATPGQLPSFEKLVCRSEFITLNAQVTSDSLRAAANLNLAKLARRLGDFVDLGGLQLDGEGSAWVAARRSSTGHFIAEGGADFQRFWIADGTGRELREPALRLQAAASGSVPEDGPVALTTATCTLTAGTDELKLKLMEPIPDAQQFSAGKLDARLAGELARWRNRLAPVVAIPKHYVLGGQTQAHGTIRFTTGTIAVDRLTLSLEKARFRGAGLDIDEPKMSAVADLTLNRTTGTAIFEAFTIQSVPLSVSSGRLIIAATDTGERVVSGGGPAVVDLNRLGKSLKLYPDPRGPEAMHGTGTGTIQFRYSGGTTTFGGVLNITNYVMGRKTAPDWEEPTVRLEADGSYTEATDTLAFKVAKVERPGLMVNVAGSLARFPDPVEVKLSGSVSYDFGHLTPKLREQLGGNFTARGKGTRPITLAGSLVPPPRPGTKQPPGPLGGITAELGIGWEFIRVYGFDMGPGELTGRLANGVARFNPLTATFGGGKVRVHPTVRLDPEPSQLTLARGLIVDRAKLTPAVCASALGYAVPAIARTGKAEGDVSFKLEENRILLGAVSQSYAKGQLIIHQATASAGPVVSLIATLLGADATTVTIANESTVPVLITNGRVHHENFAVQLGRHRIQTSGSVGFDGSLDLIVEVPFPTQLPALKATPALAKALAGKRVPVPVRGTLSAPSIDPKQFQAAIARLSAEAARDISADLLKKELEKLFPGLPKK